VPVSRHGFYVLSVVTAEAGALGGAFISADRGVITVSRAEGVNRIFCDFIAVVFTVFVNSCFYRDMRGDYISGRIYQVLILKEVCVWREGVEIFIVLAYAGELHGGVDDVTHIVDIFVKRDRLGEISAGDDFLPFLALVFLRSSAAL